MLNVETKLKEAKCMNMFMLIKTDNARKNWHCKPEWFEELALDT